ncbi:MAG: hypothetical protein V3573_04010 [Desulfovibrionaceae bacterium]
MNVRELRDLGLYLVGPEASERDLARQLLRGMGPRARRIAGSCKAVFWLGMSVCVTLGLGALR